jgi:hypothetical protein
MKREAIRYKNRNISATIVPTLSDSVTRSIRTTFSVHTEVARLLNTVALSRSVRKAATTTSLNRDRRGALHPRHRHDLDDFYPCAGQLQMGMVLAEYLRGRIMRFGLHNRIAADLIFCI